MARPHGNGAGALGAAPKENDVNNLIRGGIAGLAAWKLGGGIISTILIFILVFWLLGRLF